MHKLLAITTRDVVTVCLILLNTVCCLKVSAATLLIDAGALSADKIVLHSAEQRKQEVIVTDFDNVKAAQISWDSELAKHFEFVWTDSPQLTRFMQARLAVQVYIPTDCNASNLNLRISDHEGETFQFGKTLLGLNPGWQTLVYDLDTAKLPGSWGKKINKKLDFPVRFTGFASDFNTAAGTNWLALGTTSWEVLKSDQALDPILVTGSLINVVTPQSPELKITINNPRSQDVTGNLSLTITDAHNSQIVTTAEKITIKTGEEKIISLAKPEFYGTYYADLFFEESDSSLAPINKRYNFCYIQPAGPKTERFPGFLFGICSHPQGLSPADQRKEALAAGLCGADIIRVDAHWQRIQPNAETWDFSRFDRVVDTFGQQNLEIQAIYCYVPDWAVAADWQPVSTEHKGKGRPDYNAWGNFIRTFAERYRGKIQYVEVWNEPDLIGFANFSAAEYLELMKIAFTETRNAAPMMTVLTGGYTCMPGRHGRMSDPQHLPKTLANGKGYYDVVAFHGHGAFKSYYTQIEELVEMRRNLGVTVPWYANETAISSVHIGELAQAITLYKKFLYSWARGAIGYNWYDLRNDGNDPQNNEHNFGLLTNNFQPKAAYTVYNMLAQTFQGGRYIMDADLGENIFGFYFRDNTGDLLLACWSEAFDTRDRLLLLSNLEPQAQAEVIDLFGNVSPLLVVDSKLVTTINRLPKTIRLAQQKNLPVIHGEFLQQLDNILLAPGRDTQWQLKLSNPTASQLKFNLNFQLPADLSMSDAVDTVTIEPGQSQILSFTLLPGEQTNITKKAAISLDLNIDQIWRGKLSFPIHYVTVLTDNNFDKQPDFVLDNATQLTTLVPNAPSHEYLFWKGSSDLSAKIWLSKDQNNLLIKIEVQDDIHHQPYDLSNTWRADNIQFAIQMPNQTGNFWEIGLSHLNNGASQVYIWSAPNKFKAQAVADKIQLQTSRDEETKLTTYLAKIPFAAIGMDKSGFRFNLIVNDNDGELRESFLAIAPGLGISKSVDNYPVISF